MANSTQNTATSVPPSGMVMRFGTHPYLFAALILGAVGAVLFFLVMIPGIRALQHGGNASRADAEARLKSATDAFTAQATLVDAVVAVDPTDREKVRYTIPTEPDIPGMVVQLGVIAKASGVTLQGIDLTVPPDPKLPSQLPPSFGALDVALNIGNASYDRLKLFLAGVESNLRLIDVRGFTLAPESGTAALELRGYFIKGS